MPAPAVMMISNAALAKCNAPGLLGFGCVLLGLCDGVINTNFSNSELVSISSNPPRRMPQIQSREEWQREPCAFFLTDDAKHDCVVARRRASVVISDPERRRQ